MFDNTLTFYRRCLRLEALSLKLRVRRFCRKTYKGGKNCYKIKKRLMACLTMFLKIVFKK